MNLNNFAYLGVLIVTIFFPLLFSFHPETKYYKRWPLLLKSFIIAGPIFIVWDAVFVAQKIWIFNSTYIIGYKLFGLPIEEILFFIAIPFSIFFFLEAAFVKLPNEKKTENTNPMYFKLLQAIGIGSIIVGLITLSKIYTSFTLVLLGLSLIIIGIGKVRFFTSKAFFIFAALSYIGFFFINSILTSLPIVTYDPNHITGIKLGSIPIEDSLYLLLMLILYSAPYMHFRKKA